MKQVSLIFVTALLIPAGCLASDINGQFRNFIPQGFDSCSVFVAEVADCQQGHCAKLSLFKVWSAGYMTAYNVLSPDTYDIAGGKEADSTDRSTIIWLEEYCKQHPAESYTEAIRQLTIKLYPTRIKAAPKK